MSEQTIAEKLAAIAKNVPARSGGGSADTFVTIADITLEESVNTITIDESTFPDIAKVKDFYITLEMPKVETAQSGKLLIQHSDLILGVIETWNFEDYVVRGHFYSKYFDDNFRFNSCMNALGTNAHAAMNLSTTVSQIKEPLSNIKIRCMTTTSLMPVGTKIKIGGYVGK